jgi:solute carrier family 25 phosphate transporter 23/24/25/41
MSNDHAKVALDLFCGGVSGVLSRTAVSPLERLKILYQIQYMTVESSGGKKYNGIINSLKLVMKEEGFRGLFKGNGSNAVRVFPYIGIQFSTYEYISRVVKDRSKSKSMSAMEKLYAGSFAGMTSALCTYPLDVIRGRLSAQGAVANTKYSGMLDCFSKIVKFEGPKGLYSGISPALLGIAPYAGVNFLVYESLKEASPVAPGDSGPSAWYLFVSFLSPSGLVCLVGGWR